MRVIIATNVVVSAALRDRDPETIILFVAGHPDFQWIVSTSILEEYNEVLARKRFALPDELLQRWHKMFDALTTTISGC
jgi:predicted nucleic acid-binding protein